MSTLDLPQPSEQAAHPGPIPAPRKPTLPGPRRRPLSGGTSGGTSGGGSRDQYIDGLRALALVRVMVYHSFGWAWLPVVFPSMGVMFALGGSLVAASLSRTPGTHWVVLRKRVRRLLPPLWLYGAVLVAAMTYQGWTVTETSGTALTWRTAVNWLLPLATPPGSAWGDDFVLPLWYINTYLWFLLLSPALLWLFRRYPRATLAAPPILLACCVTGVIDPNSTTGDTLTHLGIFGACWLLGFAHHEGMIRRLPLRRSVIGGVAAMAGGLAYAFTHRQPDTGWDIDNIDPANLIYCAGAVLLLLRLYPKHTFLERAGWLSRLVTAMNARAMTIYLWGNLCIWGAVPVIESNRFTLAWESASAAGMAFSFAVACLLLVAAVLAFGWAEDVAAGRPARINPWPRPPRRALRTPATAGPKPVHRTQLGLALIGLGVTASLAVGLVVRPAVGSAGSRPAAVDAVPVARAEVPGGAGGRNYPWHLAIAAAVFRIGAVRDPLSVDGQSVTSAWDSQWATHFGGCDGAGPIGAGCVSDAAGRAGPAWFPTLTTALENPYYVGLPYNDLDENLYAGRAQLPWSADPGYAVHRTDPTVSLLKNRWVELAGPNGSCSAQVEDTGPGPDDAPYVVGGAAPTGRFGISLSPALSRCLGLAGSADQGVVDWRFIDAPAAGPWTRVITTRQVS